MTSETTLREYVVTLHRFDDLESFYADMETAGGSLYIPDRAVDVAMRRPISRNTHYLLNDQEAAQLQNDPRVLAVELTPTELGIERTPMWTQTSSLWSKSNTLAQGQLNWGLLRVTEGSQRSNWGTGGTTEVTGTVTVPFSGKNVDVVIMDGRMEPGHPEFAKSSNGTGGTRVDQYNWYALTSQVTGGTNGIYSYTPANPGNDYHGAVVAGISAGNTHGWARDANLYNIYAYNADPQFDYVRAWHANKSVNTLTGRKNPTIINCSFGYKKVVTLSSLTSIVYRGVTYTGPFTEAQVNSYGLFTYSIFENPVVVTYVTFVFSFEFERVDIEECIAAGIIVVFAAGNESSKIDVTGGQDYNNSVTTGGVTYLYNQGSSDQAQGAISVGAISANFFTDTLEPKADYSSRGPGVDVFAPGSNIRSSSKSDRIPNVPDARNSSYVVGRFDGTSYAAPQVTGVLATMLEVMPSMTPAAAMSYIISNAKLGQINDTSGPVTDPYALLGAPNRYAFAKYPATMAITPSTATVTPLQSVTYTITMTDVPDGSLVYLTESGTSISTDFNDGVTQFVLTVTSGAASLTRTASASITGSRTSIMQLRTGGYDGNIQATASTVTVSASGTISSSDATLSALTISSGTLIPTFSSNTLSYTATVANGVSSVTVTPTRNQPNATITVNGTAVTSGSPSSTINLNVGSNTITVVVTAQDGTTTKTYAIIATVSVSDFASSSGSFTIDAQGKGFFTVTPSLDSVAEGAETFTLSLRTSSVSGNIVKTSDPITINNA
jgi:hypothetical protein